ncbi:MAG: hydroxyacid dehydrogenase [Thermoanaerobaculia bacterium]|nr:hydroxyacid dehydrogenase [Thermoanaerobaculia bacterium]
MPRPRVVLTHWVHSEVVELLQPHCDIDRNETRDSWSLEETLRRCREAVAIMAFMPDRIDAAFLDASPKLRLVAGAFKGHDNVDLEACRDRGVWVSAVEDQLTVPTAELAVGLLLALTRRVAAGDRLVRDGRFRGWRPILYGLGLAGKTVGIFGLGRVGRMVARRLAGFDVRLVYCDPEVDTPPEGVLERVEFDELLMVSDHLILAAPLVPSTVGRFDQEVLSRMRNGATLVNVGRGSVVDERAVAAALENGQLAGYAADVFAIEDLSLERRPVEILPSLLRFPERTVFTPHLGSALDDVRRSISLEAAANIVDVLSGRRPRGEVRGSGTE